MPQAQSVVDIIAGCFDNDTYSDLTIKCADRSWKVHRLVVCSQSDFFHAACMTGFKEAYTGIISLDNDDPIPVEIMLKYFYNGKYNEPNNESKDLRLQLQVHVLTYNLADKYHIPTLMGFAKKKFKYALDQGPTLEDFLSVVSDIYAVPILDNTLRAITVEFARQNFRDMIPCGDLENLRVVLQDVPGFAFDLLRLFITAPLRGSCYTCGPNQNAKALEARCLKCGKGGVSLIN